jgi:hypothetical protein
MQTIGGDSAPALIIAPAHK